MRDPVVNRAWPGVAGLFGLMLMITVVGAAPWGPLICLVFASVYTLAMYRWAQARIRSLDRRSDPVLRLIRLAFAHTWTVQAGDTLTVIASVWRVPIGQLAALNHIEHPNDVRVGQVLHRPYVAMQIVPASQVEQPESPLDPLVAQEQWRDPLWSITISELGDQRQALADWITVGQKRMQALAAALNDTDSPEAAHYLDARADLDSLRAELVDLRTHMLGASRSGSRTMAEWIAVPRAELVELPRAVRASCDCRYGHYDYHAIVGHEDGRVTRECDRCDPPTRWVETGVAE